MRYIKLRKYFSRFKALTGKICLSCCAVISKMKRTIFAEGKQSISNDFRFSFGAAYNLMIRLCAPTEINNTWKIEFYIQSVTDPSLIFSLEKVLKRADVPPETVAVALQKIAVSAKLSRFSNNQHLTNDETPEFIT